MTTGEVFTRKEISKKLGGSHVPFAPTKDGKVTCLCLDPKRNPNAPEVVLPGTGKGIEQMKDLVIAQRGPFPTFIKKEVNKWEFVGEFSVAEYSDASETIDTYYIPCKTPRGQVTAVILFEKVET